MLSFGLRPHTGDPLRLGTSMDSFVRSCFLEIPSCPLWSIQALGQIGFKRTNKNILCTGARCSLLKIGKWCKRKWCPSKVLRSISPNLKNLSCNWTDPEICSNWATKEKPEWNRVISSRFAKQRAMMWQQGGHLGSRLLLLPARWQGYLGISLKEETRKREIHPGINWWPPFLLFLVWKLPHGDHKDHSGTNLLLLDCSKENKQNIKPCDLTKPKSGTPETR